MALSSPYWYDRALGRWRKGGAFAKTPPPSKLRRDTAGNLIDGRGKRVPLGALSARSQILELARKAAAKLEQEREAKKKARKRAKPKVAKVKGKKKSEPKRKKKPARVHAPIIEEEPEEVEPEPAPRKRPPKVERRVTREEPELITIDSRPKVDEFEYHTGQNKRAPSDTTFSEDRGGFFDPDDGYIARVAHKGRYEADDITISNHGLSFRPEGEMISGTFALRQIEEYLAEYFPESKTQIVRESRHQEVIRIVLPVQGGIEKASAQGDQLRELYNFLDRVMAMEFGDASWDYFFTSDEEVYDISK